ncbi:MAG: Eco57I restriction-modification methylase domain-containing protein [Candidatus Hodarchaeales archaeon]
MKDDSGRKTKDLGQYYTPSSIVDFIVQNTIGSLLKSSDGPSSDEITILDPSVGQGAFLIGAKNYLEAYQLQKTLKIANGQQIKREIVVNNLYGIDIDPKQVMDSRSFLGHPDFIGNIMQFDSLVPAPDISENISKVTPLYSLRLRYKKAYLKNDMQTITEKDKVFPLAWEEIFPETGGKFHVIIGNPPWGADITRIKGQLSYLKSATFQMDSWSLFIERSLLGLRKDGYLGFVVPNTLLLNPNFSQIRSVLLSSCQITHLINLGESVFPGVSQPAMILIARKTRNELSHRISIIPSITKQDREEILEDGAKFTSHSSLSCLQTRFSDNVNKEFDIFSLESDDFVKIVEKDLYSDQKEVCNLGTLVKNGRGVEIGKKGRIVQCPSCKRWSSPPQTERKCKTLNCGYKLSSLDKEIEIVHDSMIDPSIDRPFLVGYQIQRYFTHQEKYISAQYTGINYKNPELYQSPKLLVRKTGKGMNWVIDYNNRWVSQVVYIFQLRENLSEPYMSITLEYLLGILNSQIKKKYVTSKFLDPNRTEFPHFVQKSILQLPIKIPLSKEHIELSTTIRNIAAVLPQLYQQQHEEELTRKRNILEQIEKKEEEMENAVKTIYSIIG